MDPQITSQVLRQARVHLLAHGECPPGAVQARIASSWQRSLRAGVQPVGRVSGGDPLTGSEMRQVLTRSEDLLAIARPVMDYVFEQIQDSHSMVILANAQSTLLHTLGDAPFLNKAERVALRSGAIWTEEARGTNAIGTALVEATPLRVEGSEHFLEANSFLNCAASPIFSAQGQLLGVLDISGDQRLAQAHTLGLATTAARMIENRWLLARHQRDWRMHFHTQAEGVGTAAEGILALAPDGLLLGGNRAAMHSLKIAVADWGHLHWDDISPLPLRDWLAVGRSQTERLHLAALHTGRSVFARLVLPQAAQAAQMAHTLPALPGERAGRALPATAPQLPVADALAQLDTGDLSWRAAAERGRRTWGKGIALLVQGESGVGKELFVRALHNSSARHAAPFVAINCAAIPEHLIEAELFGYESGAFTGARRDGQLGRLREAQGGTLFLDEIGDMPLALQTRLLRVLQERSITPLGGGKAQQLDFALVCATHHQLRDAVAQGRFRADLFYRINGLALQLPALRERSDREAITRRLLDQFNPGQSVRLHPDLAFAMAHYPWPGNLREYANALQTASALLLPGEDCIGWSQLSDDLAQELLRYREGAPMAVASLAAHPQQASLPATDLKTLSHTAIAQMLQQCRGNVSQAAKLLGISRQTLYRRLKAA
ncbi:transcriptional regulator of acetoin/glycerol metabolism [Comamonas sp. BIGb0152]|uniref:sigma-54-dependent Fis family transcriptional regulator n=1 Tax=Comamonas sp. BIGb0152 TaxID=2940601 RepID=UPI00216A50B9|nr:sigma-54-dependent Fis family transcriptional regulator [Comamonas sp. BIGb0152]MCS4294677.1 transcriptional regulator of acetoin/glycerol metabolism [Comamonas sp. BIGb0152]